MIRPYSEYILKKLQATKVFVAQIIDITDYRLSQITDYRLQIYIIYILYISYCH